MSEENLERYKRQGISLYYLVKTDHSTYGDRAETFKGDGFYYKCLDKVVEYTTIYVKNRMMPQMIDPEYEKHVRICGEKSGRKPETWLIIYLAKEYW